MNLGLTLEKLLVLGVIAAIVIGPERLPRYAEKLGRFARSARVYLQTAKTRVAEEMGDDVDWRTLDPRQYDPRRIIREALLDDSPPPAATAAPVAQDPPSVPVAFVPGERPPFDAEAT